AAHISLERVIYHLMLLNARLAPEGLRHDGRRVVVAVAGKILDAELGVGKVLLDHPRNVVGRHGHGLAPPVSNLTRRRHIAATGAGRPPVVVPTVECLTGSAPASRQNPRDGPL